MTSHQANTSQKQAELDRYFVIGVATLTTFAGLIICLGGRISIGPSNTADAWVAFTIVANVFGVSAYVFATGWNVVRAAGILLISFGIFAFYQTWHYAMTPDWYTHLHLPF